MSFWSWFSAIEKSFSGGWPLVGTWASAARAAASVGAAAASISGVAPLLAILLRAHGTDHPVSYRRLSSCKARTSGRAGCGSGRNRGLHDASTRRSWMMRADTGVTEVEPELGAIDAYDVRPDEPLFRLVIPGFDQRMVVEHVQLLTGRFAV